ncbi:MAG: Uncharacterized protein FD146_1521 [Anaerolineaceae bacterium]|nr:MAG: Uncharacterized protein FD146_1521 [Anaerolineaceae bacterium]
MTMFSLRFKKSQLPFWAARYPAGYDLEVEAIAPRVRKRGYFTRDEFLTLCHWKTPRSKPRVARNDEAYIRAVTRVALSTPEERLRVEVLTLLDGVRWPTASVLLHFGHREPYPILDYRALWSLGVEAAQVRYEFGFWQEYVQYCRGLAEESNLSMREVDRALWQYAKEKQ